MIDLRRVSLLLLTSAVLIACSGGGSPAVPVGPGTTTYNVDAGIDANGARAPDAAQGYVAEDDGGERERQRPRAMIDGEGGQVFRTSR